jgi:hypothetical protein
LSIAVNHLPTTENKLPFSVSPEQGQQKRRGKRKKEEERQ